MPDRHPPDPQRPPEPGQHQVQVEVTNRLGLHARPAMAFVDVASEFDCEVSVSREDTTVNGKSIMEIMLLAATCGSELTIITTGPDAADCLAALRALVERGFDEP